MGLHTPGTAPMAPRIRREKRASRRPGSSGSRNHGSAHAGSIQHASGPCRISNQSPRAEIQVSAPGGVHPKYDARTIPFVVCASSRQMRDWSSQRESSCRHEFLLIRCVERVGTNQWFEVPTVPRWLAVVIRCMRVRKVARNEPDCQST
jgi:hypothetical protein